MSANSIAEMSKRCRGGGEWGLGWGGWVGGGGGWDMTAMFHVPMELMISTGSQREKKGVDEGCHQLPPAEGCSSVGLFL